MTQQSSQAPVTTSPPVELSRSSFAVKAEVLNGLPGFVKALGVKSVGQLLTMLVTHQDEALAALQPLAAKHNEARSAQDQGRAARRALAKKIKDMPGDEVARLLKIAEGSEQ
jgi:hypothetical protein